MDRGAWWATVHGVTKELDTTLQLNNNQIWHGVNLWDMRAGIASPVSLPGVAQVALVVKNAPASEGDMRRGLIPGSGRSPGGGQGNPFQYSCLENSHRHKTWWAVVYNVAKSWTWLSDLAHMHAPLLSSTKNSSISTLTCWEMRMLFSGEKGLSQNCPLNICLIGNKVGCC